MEAVTLTCCNETHFVRLFNSIILTEWNIYFGPVNTSSRDEMHVPVMKLG